MGSSRFVLAITALTFLLPACSVRTLVIDKLGDALVHGGGAYARDDDPDLVRDAIPFGLKTIEALLEEAPHHKGLLLAAARGFTQYAYAYVEQEADELESQDLQRALSLRLRARKLYLRARNYGLRGLEVDSPDLSRRLLEDPGTVLAKAGKEHVPLLYWTALAWGGAISISKDDSELTADLGVVERLMKRAMDLDERYEFGAVHDFYIVYEGGRPAAAGGSVERARAHLSRALELSRGSRAAPLVAFAQTVSVSTQNRSEFQQLLEKALAIDVDKIPEQRLSNLIYQKRARWLLTRTDELFVE